MPFRVISDFMQVETIAQGKGIRELKRIRSFKHLSREI
jgi:hypothetical protein